MRRPDERWVACALLIAALVPLKGDWRGPTPVVNPRMAALPRITVWAWERREDLRQLDIGTTALAYLDRTVTVDAKGPAATPRRQAMLLPASSRLVRIPVVRIETSSGAILDNASAEAAAGQIVAAIQPGISSALQIDFDAKVSERAWYRSVLERVRGAMPAAMPLSITALASWCSYDNTWLHGLPVDEAVPMLFRMEPDRRRFAPNGRRNVAQDFILREPMCMGSAGISTREAWPREMAGRRVYVFPDAGWQRDGLVETGRELARELW